MSMEKEIMDGLSAMTILCKKCTDFETCQGTGCELKNTLNRLIVRHIPMQAVYGEYKACPICNHEVGRDAEYCKNCGQKLERYMYATRDKTK